MIKIICDRCERSIGEQNDTGYVAINFRAARTRDIVADNIYEDWDLCDACMKEIVDVIEKKPPAKKDTTKKQEAKEVRKSKPSIDIGKVMALKQAGWKVKAIADEFGVTEQSINMAVYKHRKKGESSEQS